MDRILFCFLVFSMLGDVSYAQLPTYTIPPHAQSRLFCYTNKQAAFYAGVANGLNSSGFHGITREKQKLFENYWIQFGEQVLDRSTAEIEITPAGFRRRYPLYNTVEEVLFSDSLTLLCVSVRSEYRGSVRIYPGMSIWWQDATQSKHGDMYRLFKEGLQGGATVTGLAGDWDILRPRDAAAFSNPAPMHMPLMYYGQTTGTFTFAVQFLLSGIPPVPRDVRSIQRLRINKERRLESMLSAADFSCTDAVTTQAFRWISTSMDALLMRQNGFGIYAGLPWFDDYWGRDTFISLPGALLVTGRFESAKAVFRSFLMYMDRDSTSATYGRIPNRIQPQDVIYNTVDGTPWMVIQLWQYYRYSGDQAYLREIFPDIERTIAGALRHTDGNLLLTHGDAETWMDAVGPEGPWSPRGNRALDIQALWYAQLRAAANIAGVLGDQSREIGWNRYADKVRSSVHQLYVDTLESRIHDHLNADDSRDLQLRPNVLFALTIPGSDILADVSDSLRSIVLHCVFSECVFPYGVASLSQEDTNFHPWHEAPRYYVKDAAYHNGTVWTWLTGPAVSTLTSIGLQDSAWVLTQSLQRLAMDAAAVGTIPECTDALPREDGALPRWSGTFSQAWSDAEYLRNWFQDYLGVNPSWEDGAPVLRITPSIPASLLAQPGDSVAATVRVGSARIRVVYRQEGNTRVMQLRHLEGASTIRIQAGDDPPRLLAPGEQLRAAYPAPRPRSTAFPDSLPLFAQPRSADSILTVQSPPWPRIDGATATRRNEAAKELCSAFDPEGDDKGPDGSHVYPSNPLFAPGIADLRWFAVAEDKENVYFTIRMQALAQPGWHPEYGFQLTLLAIAIDQSHDAAKQSTDLGVNSGFTLPQEQGYDRLILVGGGVRVTDARGEILVEFIPETTTDAFGDPGSATIHFAIPRAYLGGGFDHWRYTILSGLQDDHGGAGIGEFRSVFPLPTDWNGGGKSGANWYDIMHCPEH
ncbi:MAG: hypothetical protein IH600_05795 [Bacteroidetes bacterium]|nr:hypothetical protein [Bacteroidota bacterium]